MADQTQLQASAGTSTVLFHNHSQSAGGNVPLQNVAGQFNMVTGMPTWIPTASSQTQMAFDSTTGRIWYYDFTNKAWNSTSVPSAISVANFFGDGSDGAATLDGTNTYSFLTKSGSTYTLTRDTYFSDLTIDTGVTLQSGGFVLFISGTLTRNGTGVIDNSGGAGGAGGAGGNAQPGSPGAGGTAGTAGAAAPGVSLPAGIAGKAGVAGTASASSTAGGGPGTGGINGSNTTNSLGANGAAGGAGGRGEGTGYFGGGGGPASTGGTATASKSSMNDVFQARFAATWVSGTYTQFSVSASSGSGGSGGAGSGGGVVDGLYGGAGGGSGGSGAPGGFLVAFVKTIVANNTNALFQSTGGLGGNGGKGGDGGTLVGGAGAGGGGGGGASGSGGIAALVYSSCDQTVSSVINVAPGNQGTGGASGVNAPGGTNATAGADGIAGNTGTSYIITSSI